jgi:hypothetical protein
VADELAVPSYMYIACASPAMFLMLMLRLVLREDLTGLGFKEMNFIVEVVAEQRCSRGALERRRR